MTDTTITLEGNPYTIKPLTVGQLEDLTAAILMPDTGDPQADARRGFQRMTGSIAAALAIDHPEITVDAIRAMRVTRHELVTAHAQVLEHSAIASVALPVDDIIKELGGAVTATRERLVLAYATALQKRGARTGGGAPGEALAGAA